MNPAWKNTARASIYYLEGKGYYVLNVRITDRGLPMETELVGVAPEASAQAEIWPLIVTAFESFAKPISHVEAETVSDQWRKQHGYKSWREFAKTAHYCTVTKREEGYIFRKGEWDGRGFGPAEGGKVELPLDTAPVTLAESLVTLVVPK